MNLQSIVITNGIGFAILIVLMISSYLVRHRRHLSDKLFTAMIIITASGCTIETLGFLCDGKVFPFSYPVYMILNSLLYVSVTAVTFLWWMYVDLRLYHSRERIRKYYRYAFIPTLLGVISIIVNFRWQILFTIDDNMIYQRKPLGYLYVLIPIINMAGSISVRQGFYKKYGKTFFFPIFMFLAPVFIGSMVQIIFYGVSLGWCSVALGLTGAYMTLQNELSYVDPLTKLFNRNYLSHILSDISRSQECAGGIMIDLDYFKDINDTFGHSTGDAALIEAANIINSAVPEEAVAVRYAGDEFIVIMRNASAAYIEELVLNIRDSVDRFNDSDIHPYKLSFSIGYSILTDGTTDKFLNEMDRYMYAEKKLKHSRSAMRA